MPKFLAVMLIVLALPLSASAQNQPTAAVEPARSGISTCTTVAITLGVVGGVVVADLLMGGALTGPLLTVLGLRPAAPVVAAVAAPGRIARAIAATRAAGIVMRGRAIAAGKEIAARVDLLYVGILGLGGVVGGWLGGIVAR